MGPNTETSAKQYTPPAESQQALGLAAFLAGMFRPLKAPRPVPADRCGRCRKKHYDCRCR